MKNLQLIAEGYHQQYGGPHAEIHALNVAGSKAKGATIYVTLEPCCHQENGTLLASLNPGRGQKSHGCHA